MSVFLSLVVYAIVGVIALAAVAAVGFGIYVMVEILWATITALF